MPKHLENHSRVTLKIPNEVWQRAEWLSAETGESRPAIIRRLLRIATRNVQPPESPKTKEFRASDEEWATLERCAKSMHMTPEDFLRGLVLSAARRLHV